MFKYSKTATRSLYYAVFHKYGGQCGICGTTKRLVIDYDRKTGLTRGLLCRKHERGLATMGTPSILRAAADYVESRQYVAPPSPEPKRKPFPFDETIERIIDDPLFATDSERGAWLSIQSGITVDAARIRISRYRSGLTTTN